MDIGSRRLLAVGRLCHRSSSSHVDNCITAAIDINANLFFSTKTWRPEVPNNGLYASLHSPWWNLFLKPCCLLEKPLASSMHLSSLDFNILLSSNVSYTDGVVASGYPYLFTLHLQSSIRDSITQTTIVHIEECLRTSICHWIRTSVGIRFSPAAFLPLTELILAR